MVAAQVPNRRRRAGVARGLALLVTGLVLGGLLWGHADPSAALAAPRSPLLWNRKKKKADPPPPPPPTRRIVIKPVDAKTKPRVLQSAAQIDKLVEANYARHKVTPNAPATDEQFVRRVYLDITGTIPTLKQVRHFLDSKDSDKRSRLIDQLLNSPGYASNFYNYWGDILRLTERLTNNAPGRPYNEWIRECLETNTPYDQMVFEMLTAEGKVWDNPAAGYILRDSGMPLDAMNNTVRIFLGTQIGCAQCHDHPFDRWKQKEFYQMAAYTFGTATRRGGRDKMFGGRNIVAELREDLKSADPKFDGGGKYNRFLQGNLIQVFDTGNKLKLPHDYDYPDGKPHQMVKPHTIFDPQPTLSPGESPRVSFARWLTSKQNPRFAKTIANRLWKRLFGRGQIEPVDDLKDDSVAENPQLMAFLESEMKRVNFDVKEYLRILLNTKTYQREATHAELSPAEPYHFPGPVLRRMTPEQVWDSFITLAVFKPEEYQIEPARVQGKLLDMDLTKATAEEIVKRDEELREATSGKKRDAREKPHKYQNVLLVRASELPVPAPAGHFLRQFGQSDREAIEASSTDGSVPQVLQMFNGPITHMLLDGRSLMYSNVMAEKSEAGRVEVVFLTILSRRPTADERKAALAEIKKNGNPGYGNVIWALVNTREFLFIQ